jgi:hypothetical protein
MSLKRKGLPIELIKEHIIQFIKKALIDCNFSDVKISLLNTNKIYKYIEFGPILIDTCKCKEYIIKFNDNTLFYMHKMYLQIFDKSQNNIIDTLCADLIIENDIKIDRDDKFILQLDHKSVKRFNKPKVYQAIPYSCEGTHLIKITVDNRYFSGSKLEIRIIFVGDLIKIE